jgi:nucleoside 2-deoxyribosyltransferase
MNPKVYLAGPITGCSFGECTDWRQEMIRRLHVHGIIGLSPMRAKDYLKNEQSITGSYEDKVMSCSRGIITRDRFDTMRCDVLLVNFLGAKKVSIGTVMEIAWADSQRIPIILVSEREGNPHEHPMIEQVTGFRVSTLDEAFDVAIKILAVSAPVPMITDLVTGQRIPDSRFIIS